MASLDDLKKRIASVKSTQKITKAMKMVAAAKLRKAQESAEKGRPYSEKMNNVILNLSSGISDKENAPKLLLGTGNDKVHLCVVMTSDRGLCGGFNSNIIKKAKSYFSKILSEGKELKIITVGSKGNDQLKRMYGDKIIENITDSTIRIAKEFRIKGPFNLQFLIHNDQEYVIELNIRASRSMPFVSKLVRTNLISLAAKAVLGKPLPEIPPGEWQKIPIHGIKVPQFSFMQLDGADIVLGVEMQSTGEAACFGNSFYDALSKALTSVGYNLPKSGAALITIGGAENKEKLLPTIALLKKLGFKLMATEHTAEFLDEKLGDVEIVHKFSEPDRKPNIADLLHERKIDFIVNIPSTSTLEKYVGMLYDEYQIRRKSLELGIPVLTTPELSESFCKTLEWLQTNDTTKNPLEPYAN